MPAQVFRLVLSLETRQDSHFWRLRDLDPPVGREAEKEIRELGAKKRIFVAGGGPAGMEFALIAGKREHDVTLYEKDDKFTGQINLTGPSPGKSVYV